MERWRGGLYSRGGGGAGALTPGIHPGGIDLTRRRPAKVTTYKVGETPRPSAGCQDSDKTRAWHGSYRGLSPVALPERYTYIMPPTTSFSPRSRPSSPGMHHCHSTRLVCGGCMFSPAACWIHPRTQTLDRATQTSVRPLPFVVFRVCVETAPLMNSQPSSLPFLAP